jgi:C_GCAxxG_C_C family probable redox protein
MTAIRPVQPELRRVKPDKVKLEQAKTDALAGLSREGPDHISCAEAVVAFAIGAMGFDPNLMLVARYFGGGMARIGEACGALIGTGAALGLRDYHLPEEEDDLKDLTTEKLQAVVREFVGEFGSCRCRNLTGYDLSTPEGLEAFRADLIQHGRCVGYVDWACDRLTPLLFVAKPRASNQP